MRTSGSALGAHAVNPGQEGLTLYIHLHKVGSDLYVEPRGHMLIMSVLQKPPLTIACERGV